MIAVTFVIETLEPVLLTQPGHGDEGSEKGLDYIPGSVLRNALASRHIAAHAIADPFDQSETSALCRQLFFSDDVRFLNSYPAHRTRERALPTPMSFFARKRPLAEWKYKEDNHLELYDAAPDDTELWRDEDDRQSGDGEWKSVYEGGAFCQIVSDSRDIEFVGVEHQIAVHIKRDHQRKLETKGDATQVFSYSAIAPGARLCGSILTPDDATAQEILNILQGKTLHIGKSRNAGYGRIRFANVQINRMWQEYIEDEEAENDNIVVTLLSDAMIRDNNGAFSNSIADELGASASDLVRCYRRMSTLGGFNQKWGLPTPQARVIQAGSVFVFKANTVLRQKLGQLVETGIGERRRDGFGRIAVNWYVRSSRNARRIERRNDPQNIVLTNPHSIELAQRIVAQQARTQLDKELQTVIDSLRFSGKVPNALLSRIRNAAAECIAIRDLEPLRALLKDIEGKAAGKSLEKILIRDQKPEKALDWLRHRANNADLEARFRINLDAPTSLSIGGVKASTDDALKHEYTARLIEGLMHQQIRRQKRDGQ